MTPTWSMVTSTVSQKYVSSSGSKYLIVLGCNRRRLPGIRPLKRMSKVGVPSLNEAMNEGAQVMGRATTRPAQAFAAQDREPNLDLVKPRTMSGQPVEGDLGPLGSAPSGRNCCSIVEAFLRVGAGSLLSTQLSSSHLPYATVVLLCHRITTRRKRKEWQLFDKATKTRCCGRQCGTRHKPHLGGVFWLVLFYTGRMRAVLCPCAQCRKLPREQVKIWRNDDRVLLEDLKIVDLFGLSLQR